MKRIMLLNIIALISIIANAQFANESYFKSNRHNEDPLQSFKLKSAFVEKDGYADWDLTFNSLNLTIDPAKFYISGTVYFKFISNTDGLSSVSIDLNDGLSVESVVCGDRNCQFSHSENSVKIDFPVMLSKNEKGNFTIKYKGEPHSVANESYTSEISSSGTPVTYTLSEPYGAKDWWPCKQSLEDKIDSIDIIVTTPSKYRTASNGLLFSDSVSNGKRSCYWKHRHPIATYLVFFSSTDYDVYSEQATLADGSNVEILNYVYQSSSKYAREQTLVTKDYIEFFSKKFIDYPFKNEKYGHAQFGWGGGMEHQTMSSMGGFSEGLISHELAHQWFGDYITCGSWNEIWLNEGFATFLEAMTYEEFFPESWPYWKKYIIESVTSEPGGSVYCNNPSNIDRLFDGRLSYNKGSYVLQMLRGQLGETVFFDGMKKYLTDPRVTNGFATTDLFRENMELAADTTLAEFFKDWIYGEGYPKYATTWSSNNNRVDISIIQKPSISGGPFFEMKVPITVYKDGNSETFWLMNTQTPQAFTVNTFAKPDSIVFDEHAWILCKKDISLSSLPVFASSEIKATYNKIEKQIILKVPDLEQVSYSIYNINGRIMTSGRLDASTSAISVASFNSGIYVIHLKRNKESVVGKISIY